PPDAAIQLRRVTDPHCDHRLGSGYRQGASLRGRVRPPPHETCRSAPPGGAAPLLNIPRRTSPVMSGRRTRGDLHIRDGPSLREPRRITPLIYGAGVTVSRLPPRYKGRGANN